MERNKEMVEREGGGGREKERRGRIEYPSARGQGK